MPEGPKPEVPASERAAYADGCAFVDGAYLPIAEARIPITDWGFIRSDATYDVAHVWRGRFFRLEDHLDRFEASVAKLRLALPYTRDEVRDILMACVRLSGLRDAFVEFICTRGQPPFPSRDPRDCENRFYAFAVPFVWIADEAQRARGLHAVVAETVRRIPADAVDPTTKNYHWLDLIMGLHEAYDRGGETVILADAAGNVTEGPGFNVFAVAGGTVTTPHRGALEGITRRTAIELCAETNLEIRAAPLPVAELLAADEVFLTSTAGGIMPVASLNGAPLPGGAPGPVSKRLHDLYWSKKAAGWHGTAVAYD